MNLNFLISTLFSLSLYSEKKKLKVLTSGSFFGKYINREYMHLLFANYFWNLISLFLLPWRLPGEVARCLIQLFYSCTFYLFFLQILCFIWNFYLILANKFVFQDLFWYLRKFEALVSSAFRHLHDYLKSNKYLKKLNMHPFR